MSKIIQYIAVFTASSAFPLFIIGIVKVFRGNIKDMEKRRIEKRHISEVLHNMHYGETTQSQSSVLAHAHETD